MSDPSPVPAKPGFFRRLRTLLRDLREDLRRFDRRNESEAAVLAARCFSCYRGVLVLKTHTRASFSFGLIGLSRYQQSVAMLRHEYGHRLQLRKLGLWRYIRRVAVPSLTANLLSRRHKLPYDYYGSPWEAEADRLGQAQRSRDNHPWPAEACSRSAMRKLWRERKH